jgi:hypothetical protein
MFASHTHGGMQCTHTNDRPKPIVTIDLNDCVSNSLNLNTWFGSDATYTQSLTIRLKSTHPMSFQPKKVRQYQKVRAQARIIGRYPKPFKSD